MASLRRLVSSMKLDRTAKSTPTPSPSASTHMIVEDYAIEDLPGYEAVQSPPPKRKLKKKRPTTHHTISGTPAFPYASEQFDYFGHSFYSPGDAATDSSIEPSARLHNLDRDLPPPYLPVNYELPPLPPLVASNVESTITENHEAGPVHANSDDAADIPRVIRTDSGIALEDDADQHSHDAGKRPSLKQQEPGSTDADQIGHHSASVVEDAASDSDDSGIVFDMTPLVVDEIHPTLPICNNLPIPSNLRVCIVCHESMSPLDFPARAPTTSCSHAVTTCTACLRIWIATELQSRGSTEIQCPECPTMLSYDEVRIAASSETFNAYDRAFTRHTLANLRGFAWCTAVGCPSGQVNSSRNNPYMNCMACGWEQCLVHETAWHAGETCDQFDARTGFAFRRMTDDQRAQASLDSVSKPCPGLNCGWRIQKVGGCDHMTCNKCRHEFCYSCLASQENIRREGNTAHKSDCRHHTDNLERRALQLASLT